MSAIAPVTAVSAASSFEVGTVQSAVAMTMLKASLVQQEQSAMQLIEALPQRADSGSVGTRLHEVG